MKRNTIIMMLGLFFVVVAGLVGCGGGGGNTPNNSVTAADAGPIQNVSTGTLVTLNGSNSTGENGKLITYQWAFVSKPVGSSAVLSNPTVVNPTFTPDLPGVYVLGLVVNDGSVSSSQSTVTITASKLNSSPVANAGTLQNVMNGSVVTLDGSKSSDADSDLITYSWSFISVPTGSNAVLSATTIVNPTFATDVTGAYVLALIVNDGKVDSAISIVTITSAKPNSAPVANAGINQNITIGSNVTLNGSGSSDADGDILTYSWAFTSKPTGSGTVLSNTAAVMPTFTPDIAGAYVVNLFVYDGKMNSTTATVTVNVAIANAAPISNAGVTQNIGSGTLVTLDGSASSDANGDQLTYSWAFTSKPVGSSATLSNATAVKPTFTPDVAGTYVFNLIVNDGKVNSTADTVSIQASIQTPSFSKVFSGTTALVLDSFTLPSGLYKVSVNTTGYFNLFDVNNNETLFSLSSGRAINAETFIKSNGSSYLFRTDNISKSWTLTFTNIDLSNPQPIENMNSISENVPKLLGPYIIDLSTYKVTMNTSGYLQLFPLNPITGNEESYIFNESSGNFGAQNVYTPTSQIILFRTDNISTQYGFNISKL